MKKIVCYILLANLIIIVLIIYAKYFNYSKRIDIKFIDKIQFDEPITEILPDYYFYPRLYCIKKDDFFIILLFLSKIFYYLAFSLPCPTTLSAL